MNLGALFANQKMKYCEISPTETNENKIMSILYTNRSITNFNLNKYRDAAIDATRGLYSDMTNKEAFVARGKASLKMRNFESAYNDFIEALKLDPQSKYIFQLSNSTYYKIKEETVLNEIKTTKYLISNYQYYPIQRKVEKEFDFDAFSINDAKEICKIVQKFELPTQEVVYEILQRMCNLLNLLPNIVHVDDVKEVIIVGDTHGQLQDVLNIFKMHGYPTPERPYLFNGDFVDRGSQGLEILLILFAFKIADERCIYINRGNQYVFF